MTRLTVLLGVTVLVACSGAREPGDKGKSAAISQPNFLIIVADDLGYSDLGVFGGEIGTPNLDQLANDGVLLTNFYVAPTCSPTRAMLLTGADNHLTGLGSMGEELQFMSPHLLGKPGYEGYLNDRFATLPEILQEAGYRTYMTGKWHLGEERSASPFARGFSKTFTLLEGGANHLNGGNVVSLHDREDALFRRNGELIDAPGNGFYSTRDYSRQMIEYLKSDQDSDQPFFAYLAFTAPHWPLQAPQESIARFLGKYEEGYEVIFDRRLARQKALGLVDDAVLGQDLTHDTRPWEELSAADQKEQARMMEIYAAMVSDIDIYVGEVIEALKQTGELENTVIVFLSDNGAQGGDQRWMPGFDQFLEKCCDQSLSNLGAVNSYVLYGSGWARVSGSPSKYFKSYTTEGGILSPAFLYDPRQTSKIDRFDGFVSVKDLAPTILDMAGIPEPNGTFRGRSVLPMQGRSMRRAVNGDDETVHGPDFVMGWELMGHQALRKGDWKVVLSQPPLGDRTWRLYNVEQDPSEARDLSEEYPAILQDLLTEWDAYVTENAVQVRSHP